MNYELPFALNEAPEEHSSSQIMEDAVLNTKDGFFIPDNLNITQAATKLSNTSLTPRNGYKVRPGEATTNTDNHSHQIVSQSGPDIQDIVTTHSDFHSLKMSDPGGISTNSLTSNSTAAEHTDLDYVTDFTKLALPNFYPDWSSDTDFLGQENIIQPGLLVPNTMSTLFPLDNHIFDMDNNYTSHDTGLNKQWHRDNWVQFETDDDPVKSTSTDLFNVPNGVLQHPVLEELANLNYALADSKSDPNTRNAHNNEKANSNSSKESHQHLITDVESVQFNSHKLPDPGKHKGKESKDSNRSTTHIHKAQRHSETDSQTDLSCETDRQTDLSYVLSDDELIINTTSLTKHSGRNSAPTFSRDGGSGSYFWKQQSTYPGSYSETEQHVMSLFSEVHDWEEDSSQYQQHFLFNRPHSVATSFFINDVVYDSIQENIQEEPILNHATAQGKRKQFHTNYGTTKSASMPEGSNQEKFFQERFFQDPLNAQGSRETKMIFKTPSSASLLGDSEQVTSPPTVSSRTSQNRLTKLKSIFSDKTKDFRFSPLDDSMTFETEKVKPSSDDAGNKGRKSDAVKVREKSKNNKNDLDGKDNKTDGKTVEPTTELQEESEEKDTKTETRTAVYKRRWYLLFLFSLSALLWNAVWSTWGPIAQSAKLVYDWTDGDIAMFIWLGNIPFLITMFPSSYLMDVTGMRVAMIVACGFMFLGTGFRCIPSDIGTASWLIRTGQFLNGMAGTIPNSGPALLSALWFPPNQRASATAISTVAGYMGASISFVVGPLMVPQPNDLAPVNNTDDGFSVSNYLDTDNSTSNTTSYDAQKTGIMNMLYAECAVAGLLFVLVLIYFPSKPPLPPSISASIPREKYIKGLKMLIRNKQFWVCALAFSVPVGVYEAWQVILDVNLDARGISQETAGWLDFYATVGGCVSGLLVCRFADFFTRQIKLFLLVFYFFASVAVLWFTLVVLNILPFDHVSIFAAIIIAGVFIDGGGPLFFELTIEVSYPVGEGVTSGFTQMLCAAAGIVFLSVVQIEILGKQWMNWCFFGCVALTIPLLFFINTTYGRADIDDMEIDVSEDGDAATNIEAADSNEKTYLVGSSNC